MTVFDALYRDIIVKDVKFVGKSNHMVTFIDGFGETHRVKVREGIDKCATFEYNGGWYYLYHYVDRGVNWNMNFAIGAYRLCKDVLVCATDVKEVLIPLSDFKFKKWILYPKN